MHTHGGDDLDDLILDESLVALSDGEQDDFTASPDSGSMDGHMETASSQAEQGSKRKRKERTKERKAKVCAAPVPWGSAAS